MFYFLFLNFLFCVILLLLFFSFTKSESFNISYMNSFECGYTPYFFSRYSFSIHYYIVGLIFLFLDLELGLLLLLFSDNIFNFNFSLFIFIFIFSLLLGLIYEWLDSNLSWKF